MNAVFRQYLKEMRNELGLTQSEAVELLNTQGGDLKSIDCVTFSRWERGITQPTLSRRVKVLRVFRYDLLDYLLQEAEAQTSEKKYQSRVNHFSLSIKKRYQGATTIVSSVNYNNINSNLGDVKEISVNSSNRHYFLDIFHNFHIQTRFSDEPLNIREIDISDYVKKSRAIVSMYALGDAIVGHNICFIFRVDTLSSEIQRINNCNLSINSIALQQSVPLSKNGNYSYLSISHHAMTEETFFKQLKSEFTYLIKNTNIHNYYCQVSVECFVDVMLKMGFNIVAWEGESDIGAISVGSKKYMTAIMHIETCELFSQPEFFYIINHPLY
ncbi:DNA-binding protein [Vibrio mimicus]|nr:DNA-binding protein [Vibrio mimicus]QXC58838.1 DNA-binding protein [Vibrio mimicus]